MDIRPPKHWQKRLVRPSRPSELEQSVTLPPEIVLDVHDEPKPRTKRRWLRWLLLGTGLTIFLAAAGGVTVYLWSLQPVSSDTTISSFKVTSGETPSVIGKHLEEKRLIRSSLSFELYVRIHDKWGTLKAGTYKLSPSLSVFELVEKLTKGEDDVYNVMIPPGVTLKQLADPNFKGSFVKQGFSEQEISRAFSATYSSKLLKDRPVGASLEGYIFPETFQVRSGDNLESILARSFDELYNRLEKDGLLAKFSTQGFTIYQALTLASVVQEETGDASVQTQVAQVFLKRLREGMALGSDVTFIYAARQDGKEPTPDYNSLYNTRIHPGLPPGPIATSNYSALKAVAEPASGDYLFFVAGDDGKVYFSRTNEEHEQLVRQYCHTLCQ